MKKIKFKLIILIFSGLLFTNYSIAMKYTPKLIDGFDKAKDYLDYALYAMTALGAIAMGFMLLNTPNDPIMKHAARWTALAGVLSAAYKAPGWFGLNIIL